MTITANIESIGFEAEGGINQREYDNLRNEIQSNGLSGHFQVKHDGTVSVSDREISGREYNYWSGDLLKIKKFLKLLYKHGFKSNSSCGFHIHVRFANNKKAVSYFSFEKFVSMFMRKYTKDFKESQKYIARKTNHYCSSRGISDNVKRQLKGGGSRYSAINLLSLQEEQNTIEFRIFPHQDSYEESIETISWLLITLENIFEHDVIFEEEINVLGGGNV